MAPPKAKKRAGAAKIKFGSCCRFQYPKRPRLPQYWRCTWKYTLGTLSLHHDAVWYIWWYVGLGEGEEEEEEKRAGVDVHKRLYAHTWSAIKGVSTMAARPAPSSRAQGKARSNLNQCKPQSPPPPPPSLLPLLPPPPPPPPPTSSPSPSMHFLPPLSSSFVPPPASASPTCKRRPRLS